MRSIQLSLFRSVTFSITLLMGIGIASSAIGGTFPATDAADARLTQAKIRAAHFLSKATFGPTPADIDSLATRISQIGYRRACSEWIDDQMDTTITPVSSHVAKINEIFAVDAGDVAGTNPPVDPVTPFTDGIGVTQRRYQAWWDIALRGEDQLRQRVAWALAQIFVIDDSAFGNNDPDFNNTARWLSPSIYYDTVLIENAFGNFRDLLDDMTYSPVMGTYLSHLRNRKANIGANRFPDENYAREIMQLFTIGLYELHQDGRLKETPDGELIPTYDNLDIETLGRLFTGFKYENDNTNIFGPINLSQPMEIWAPEHDNNLNYSADPGDPAEKSFLGATLSPLPDPLTEQDVRDEIGEGLDVLFNHPNVAPFLSRLLIQRLVKSNPSRAYIRRVAEKFNGDGNPANRGNFAEVVKAIYLDPEFSRGQRVLRRRSPHRVEVRTRGTEYSRLREPVLRVTSFIRAMEPETDYKGTDLMMLKAIDGDFAQSPFKAPSVFNFYLPDYQPPGDIINYQTSRRLPRGDLVAPEFQIIDAVIANKLMNKFANWARSGDRSGTAYENPEVDTSLYSYNGTNHRSKIILTSLIDDYSDPDFEDVANLPKLLQKYDLLLCNGTLSEDTKDAIVQAMEDFIAGTSTSHKEVRLEESILAILLSPDCAIEE